MLGSLMQTIDSDHEEVKSFFESQDVLYHLLDTMIISCRNLLLATAERMPTDESSVTRYMLWRTMYDYTETSLLLAVKTRIDEGYALLRMAAELCRDIARIAESRDNFDLRNNRSLPQNQARYRKVFRFNEKDKIESHVFHLYNLASAYGVHGHQTRDALLKPTGEVLPGGYIVLNVPERARLEALDVWLFSFFPLHFVAGRTFASIYSSMTPNPLKRFFEAEEQLMPVLQEFRRNVRRGTASPSD